MKKVLFLRMMAVAIISTLIITGCGSAKAEQTTPEQADTVAQADTASTKAAEVATEAPADTDSTKATEDATEAQATEDATEAPATEDATEAPATEDATEAQATEDATEAQATNVHMDDGTVLEVLDYNTSSVTIRYEDGWECSYPGNFPGTELPQGDINISDLPIEWQVVFHGMSM